MAEITAALDEGGANKLFDIALTTIGPLSDSGTGNLGPFVATYSVNAALSNGTVDLIPPDTIRIADLRLDWTIHLTFSFDLSSILPDFCLPQICVRLPFIGRVCTPKICINWPTITIPVNYGDFVKATADFKLAIALSAGTWNVSAVIAGVPNLQFGAATAGLLIAIGAAATPILLAIPFLGPFLAIAVNAILLAIAIAGVTGFLGPILSPFISGLSIPIYSQPQVFAVLPASGPVDPEVNITLDLVAAAVIHNAPEDELVLTVDISP